MIMMSATRPCFTTHHQTCKTKTNFWSQTGLVLRLMVLDHVTGIQSRLKWQWKEWMVNKKYAKPNLRKKASTMRTFWMARFLMWGSFFSSDITDPDHISVISNSQQWVSSRKLKLHFFPSDTNDNINAFGALTLLTGWQEGHQTGL